MERYPHDDRAPQALYRIARIVDSDLHDYRKAIALYGDVMECYPRSPEAADCQWRIDHLVAQHVRR